MRRTVLGAEETSQSSHQRFLGWRDRGQTGGVEMPWFGSMSLADITGKNTAEENERRDLEVWSLKV